MASPSLAVARLPREILGAIYIHVESPQTFCLVCRGFEVASRGRELTYEWIRARNGRPGFWYTLYTRCPSLLSSGSFIDWLLNEKTPPVPPRMILQTIVRGGLPGVAINPRLVAMHIEMRLGEDGQTTWSIADDYELFLHLLEARRFEQAENLVTRFGFVPYPDLKRPTVTSTWGTQHNPSTFDISVQIVHKTLLFKSRFRSVLDLWRSRGLDGHLIAGKMLADCIYDRAALSRSNPLSLNIVAIAFDEFQLSRYFPHLPSGLPIESLEDGESVLAGMWVVKKHFPAFWMDFAPWMAHRRTDALSMDVDRRSSPVDYEWLWSVTFADVITKTNRVDYAWLRTVVPTHVGAHWDSAEAGPSLFDIEPFSMLGGFLNTLHACVPKLIPGTPGRDRGLSIRGVAFMICGVTIAAYIRDPANTFRMGFFALVETLINRVPEPRAPYTKDISRDASESAEHRGIAALCGGLLFLFEHFPETIGMAAEKLVRGCYGAQVGDGRPDMDVLCREILRARFDTAHASMCYAADQLLLSMLRWSVWDSVTNGTAFDADLAEVVVLYLDDASLSSCINDEIFSALYVRNGVDETFGMPVFQPRMAPGFDNPQILPTYSRTFSGVKDFLVGLPGWDPSDELSYAIMCELTVSATMEAASQMPSMVVNGGDHVVESPVHFRELLQWATEKGVWFTPAHAKVPANIEMAFKHPVELVFAKNVANLLYGTWTKVRVLGKAYRQNSRNPNAVNSSVHNEVGYLAMVQRSGIDVDLVWTSESVRMVREMWMLQTINIVDEMENAGLDATPLLREFREIVSDMQVGFDA
ncbi:hypothetical protein M427DRAFT_67131 [Gonapodya prolifera JEL478]|uniref:F-box domain-containing protein n=1 Tax=Gonapodya prolifera (strain JEL478) TaxID=1344416 RepID=A0A139ARX5_GONPJ|nr:hypothetical protein M427DRAFT_67131 [Gonapodya prolifera JEL478]|eukprot:KXS19490.1 hypothetical protein M427DRAFT_67131 [Gonapodya prolifera JEL478]